MTGKATTQQKYINWSKRNRGNKARASKHYIEKKKCFNEKPKNTELVLIRRKKGSAYATSEKQLRH